MSEADFKMNFLNRGSREWFIDAAVFAMYFEHRAIYSLAQAILARWFESDERLR
jgi:hypothetical protein